MSSITIKDVAAKSGVTVTTVSRVLNNRGYISENTRKKVYDAMEELNYRPNEMARFLSKQQTNYIGVVLPSAEHPFFGKALHWFEYYASLNGYKVMVCISNDDRSKELEYIDLLRSNRVVGIVLCTHSDKLEKDLDPNCPIIGFERDLSEAIPIVSCDNYQGGVLAAKRLLEAGCRNIALFSGTQKRFLPPNFREYAFQQVCEENGNSVKIIYMDEMEADRADREAQTLCALQKNPDLDGIFATSDMMAAYVIRACNKLGRRVPEDVSVIGFDDINISELTCPAITTIHQPIKEMCQHTIEAIIKKANSEMIPSKIMLPVRLVERESVRKAR